MAATFPELEARVATLILPIAGAKPSGEDVSFDPDFERVKAEVDKLGSVSAGAPDWVSVVDLSGKLLSTRSKDMRLATWLTLAKMNTSGWNGLAEGLLVLRELATKHWDTMYPERRPRARANLYGWLVEHIAATLEPVAVAPTDAEAIRASNALFREIDAELSEKLGDLHPGMGMVRRLLESRVAALAAAAPPPAPAAAPAASGAAQPAASAPAQAAPAAPVAAVVTNAAPAPVFAAAAPPVVTSADSVTDALNACRGTILQAAALLWAQDRTMAWAYSLQRVGTWLAVRAVPPVAPDSQRTGIPAPPPVVRRPVEDAFGRSRWADVLGEAEPLAARYIYWLDLHRFIALSLAGLGPEYAAANAAVRSQVRGFVERFPALTQLEFADGTPLANAETRTWLSSLAGSGGASGESAAAAAEKEAAAEAESAVAAAREALEGGRVGEGVGLLLTVSRRARDGHEKFEKLLLAARMAVEGKKPTLARPLLEELLQRIDQHQLETWQPELCVAVYTTVLEALRASKPAAADKPQRETEAGVLEKICRLDPALAVRLGM
jgi:type VI secretion system protein VasJ